MNEQQHVDHHIIYFHHQGWRFSWQMISMQVMMKTLRVRLYWLVEIFKARQDAKLLIDQYGEVSSEDVELVAFGVCSSQDSSFGGPISILRLLWTEYVSSWTTMFALQQ